MAEIRAVVTGIGCVTPIGIGVEALWAGVQRGESAVKPIDRFVPEGLRSRIAAQIPHFDATAFLDKKRAHRMDRYSQLAVAGGIMALRDAGLDAGDLETERAGVFMGSALGGIAFAEEQCGQFMQGGFRSVSPTLGFSVFGGAASCNLAMEFGFTGPNETNSMSCGSGAVAIGRALQAIRRGEADVVMAGGSEAPLAPLSFGAFDMLRAMSTRNEEPSSASRPFDRNRDGFVMGEGSAILVIEAEHHARARGARIYGELAGFGLTNDAHHMSVPLPSGEQAARALKLALSSADMSPDDVAYVNAHGSSTLLNDVTESKVIRSVFGSRPVAVSGTKGLYGHPLGASGAIEAAITLLSLNNGWLPPTTNLNEPDPAAEIDLVSRQAREVKAEAAVSNSYGFGGVNAVLAFRKA
ncbi:beta-ketoacyl-[acyl-carrier-protein] synthase family protein [Paenibacillus glycanilyticus]|uniref:beta-ketoacyl-[acyl-carrier-protein] synthase family protein n=1 Tax=Paenibacillus glycanilyticus TaxID=126569 RepID=UPI00203E7B12|nr:beta-ketoacyl-[acyl-carrier-protein] synthase family protein [Paenibacillus glycanilyticus]MCM3627576.1 beta-ketoacyl-[acyl-carrier-protein] synthase family protein [Paenibacillus glycanilyticus]